MLMWPLVKMSVTTPAQRILFFQSASTGLTSGFSLKDFLKIEAERKQNFQNFNKVQLHFARVSNERCEVQKLHFFCKISSHETPLWRGSEGTTIMQLFQSSLLLLPLLSSGAKSVCSGAEWGIFGRQEPKYSQTDCGLRISDWARMRLMSCVVPLCRRWIEMSPRFTFSLEVTWSRKHVRHTCWQETFFFKHHSVVRVSTLPIVP